MSFHTAFPPLAIRAPISLFPDHLRPRHRSADHLYCAAEAVQVAGQECAQAQVIQSPANTSRQALVVPNGRYCGRLGQKRVRHITGGLHDSRYGT
jgi:hypothetical protein